MTTITRFAPSPTGLLHLGSGYSAIYAFEAARSAQGRFLLRIEDIDETRCRPEFTEAIYEDLSWLGLTWEQPVRIQSEHLDEYTQALDQLREQELLYPCFCTRRDIAAEIKAAGGAPHGPDGPVYPGTCKSMGSIERADRIIAGEQHAWRLDMAEATRRAGKLAWHDVHAGRIDATPGRFGDVVIARKETPTSYHLSVTLDDHLQGVTLVPRGIDLFDATDIHRLLQALLDLDTPTYDHHRLILDADGNRLAKRDRSTTIASLREDGVSPNEVRARMGYT